jgi:hypothetical protein
VGRASPPAEFEAHVAACWTKALDVWGTAIELSPPQKWESGDEDHWGQDEPLAFIELNKRQVVVNFGLLDRIGAGNALTGVLAHEIGHHAAFPHTLGVDAALEVLQRKLLPHWPSSLTNLFWDLLVNERVGQTHAADLQAVYRGFAGKKPTESSMFAFYLAIYEELWGLPPDALSGPGTNRAMDTKFPGFRGDARVFAQTFWSLDGTYLAFVYFCGKFARYLPEGDGKDKGKGLPLTGDVPSPDADDYAGALMGSAAADDAIREAQARGWLDDADASKLRQTDPMTVIQRLGGGRPGVGGGAFKKALVGKYYRRLVDEHLIELPQLGDPPPLDAIVPSITEDWDWGDPLSSIDWGATVRARGELGAAMPLMRAMIPTEPDPSKRGVPAMEIFLDTSGSMPDPTTAVNAMTLAAQILATATIRRNGRVRAVIYSYGNPLVSDWMYDEETAREFLLHYVGGGTDYPFDILERWAKELEGALRVIVSDMDFISNVSADGAMTKLVEATRRSARLVALLGSGYGEEHARNTLAPALAEPAFRYVPVRDANAFGKAAGDLSRALLES